MRLKVKTLSEGLHPEESVVVIEAEGHNEYMAVSKRVVSNETVEIGYPIQSRDGKYLVELPSETSRGAWRVWVDRKNVLESVTA